MENGTCPPEADPPMEEKMENITITGIVVHGNHRGKQLGFPTANIKLDQEIEEGIYISTTRISKGSMGSTSTIGTTGNIPNLIHSRGTLDTHDTRDTLTSLTFIGSAKTFGQTDVLAETYILDFDTDIYGQEINIELLKKIRDNQKFEGVEKLVEQMKQDEQDAREYFKLSS